MKKEKENNNKIILYTIILFIVLGLIFLTINLFFERSDRPLPDVEGSDDAGSDDIGGSNDCPTNYSKCSITEGAYNSTSFVCCNANQSCSMDTVYHSPECVTRCNGLTCTGSGDYANATVCCNSTTQACGRNPSEPVCLGKCNYTPGTGNSSERICWGNPDTVWVNMFVCCPNTCNSICDIEDWGYPICGTRQNSTSCHGYL